MKRRAGCSTKAIDGLIGIADAEDVRLGSRQRRENLDLREVGILKFVDQNEADARALRSQHLFVARQQLVGPRDHVAECAQIFFAQPALGGGKDAGNFLAASDHLGIAQLIFRFRNPGNRRFAALQPRNVLRVPFGRNQFVVTPAEEAQQIVEKLPHIRCPDVVFEMKLVNSLAQINPEIFFVEHAKVFLPARFSRSRQ